MIRLPIRNKFPLPTQKKDITITPEKPKERMQGLGDVVAKVANPIKHVLEKNSFLKNKLENCNCEKRRQWLNERFSFNNEN